MSGIDETYYVGNYDGVPGLVWYSDATQVRGDELKLGDWLDSLDHRGARLSERMSGDARRRRARRR